MVKKLIKDIKHNRTIKLFNDFLSDTTKINHDNDITCSYIWTSSSGFSSSAYLYSYHKKSKTLTIYHKNLIWRYDYRLCFYKLLCDKETISKLICDDFYKHWGKKEDIVVEFH